MIGTDKNRRDLSLLAFCLGARAAGREGAAGGNRIGGGRQPDNRFDRPIGAAKLRNDDAPAIHHMHEVAELSDDADIVADENQGGASIAPKLVEQLENLRLRRHVERGRGLIGDDDLGVVGERHGDGNALALAARKLMRIGVGARRGVGDAHRFHQLDRPPHRLGAREPLMAPHALGDLFADSYQRIERGQRILEDVGDAIAANLLQTAERRVQQVLLAIENFAAHNLARRRGDQPKNGERGNRLSRT